MSVEATAAHLGFHANTIRKHIDGNKQFIFTVKAEVETLLAVQTSKTVVEVKARAEDRVKNVFGRALTLTEKAIKKAEDKGDDITLEELMDIHNKITVWSSKFIVSEAPKHLKVGGEVIHTHELPSEAWERLEALQRKMIPAHYVSDRVIDVPSGPAERD